MGIAKRETSKKNPVSMREAQLNFIDYFINNRTNNEHPKEYTQRMALIKQYSSQQQVYFRQEFLPAYKDKHHLDHLKLGYKPNESKSYDAKKIDLAPEWQDATYRDFSKYRVVYGPVPYYLKGFDKQPDVIDTISACAINLMGTSKADEAKFMPGGRLDEIAFREECRAMADFLLSIAKSRGANKFVMPAFGVGVYIQNLKNTDDKAKAKEIMNKAFAEMARKHEIMVDWVVWKDNKNASHEKNLLDSQTQGNAYMNHVIADLMEHAQTQNNAGYHCAMLNPGSDRTIGGKYIAQNPDTLEEQMAQQSDLLFLHSVYNENMIHRFELDLKLAKQNSRQKQPKSIDAMLLLKKMHFDSYIQRFNTLKNELELQNPNAAKALEKFIERVTAAKDEWIRNPNHWSKFVKHCQNALNEAKNSSLQDFSEWNILKRGFMKMINWLASFFSNEPVYKSKEYAELSIFSKQITNTKPDIDLSEDVVHEPKKP
ncbi:TPA: hypothetical protein ACQ53F_001984 [Legionella pneumophila]